MEQVPKHEFDDYAENYRENINKYTWPSGETTDFFAKLRAKKLLELTKDRKETKSILDFGCGDGLMTSFVSEQFPQAKVYGIDPSSKSIEIGQKNHPNINLSVSHGTIIEFPDNSMDVVCAAGSFHHIDWAIHEAYLKEIFRVLTTNGTFVLFELNPLNPFTLLSFMRNPIDNDAKIMPPWYSKKVIGKFGKAKLN